jgi:acetyl-CoA carboxylase carboxyl transferase subunit alpha
MRTLLEFEKPIAELEAKLEDMKKLASENNVDVSSAVRNLTNSIEELRKETFTNLTRWQRVQLSRHPDRPYSLDYIQMMCEEFHEIHGDRNVGDDPAIVGGFGNIDGQTVMIIGQQKGRKTKERQYRNFGMPNPEGYRKALRLMHMAEKFDVPVVTLIDTPGAFPGLEAEERGQGEAIARNIKEMMTLKVPVICVVIGEGASGGALGIGIGDRVLMMENSWYSVISPENCSTILWRSWDFKEQAADALKLTAEDMKGFGLVDGIIPEPRGGAHLDFEKAGEILKKTLLEEIKTLAKQKPADRIDARIDKFCSMGVVVE